MFPTVFTLPPLFGKQNRAQSSTLSPNRANPQIPQFSISKLTQDTVSFGASVQATHTPVRFGAALPPTEPPGGGGHPWDGHYQDYEDYELDFSTPYHNPFEAELEAEPDTSSSRPDSDKAAKRSERNRAYKDKLMKDPKRAEELRAKRRLYEAERRKDPKIAKQKREISRKSKANRKQDPEKAARIRKQDQAYKERKRQAVGDNGSSGQSANQPSYTRSVFTPAREENRSILAHHQTYHSSSSQTAHTGSSGQSSNQPSYKRSIFTPAPDTRSLMQRHMDSHSSSSIAAGMENMSLFSMQPPARQVPYDTPAPPVPRADSPPGWRFSTDGNWIIYKDENGVYDSQWTAVTRQTPEPQ